jgi:RNA polymerase sigma-70 factor (ECF subfamily)
LPPDEEVTRVFAAKSPDLRPPGRNGFRRSYATIFLLTFQLQSAADIGADVARLERIVAHDSAALGELYDRHSRRLFGVIVRILKDRGEAEEVLQEVFMQAWTRACTYNLGLGSPVGWLLGIARNRAIDRLRANSVRVRAVEAVPEPPRAESPEGRAAGVEQQRDVQRALETLPSEQRELIEQAYFLGFTHSELATRFHLPIGTVKTRIRTAMLSLRGHFEAGTIQQ